MSLDFGILALNIVQLCIFIVLQIIFFRFIKPEQIINYIIYIYVATGLVGSAILYFFSKMSSLFQIYDWKIITVLIGTSAITYSLCVSLYIIGIFGIVESSIRIKILSLIYGHKIKIKSRENILKVYNKRVIIKKRLLRLQNSGDLIKERSKYYPGKRRSIFIIMVRLSKILAGIYG